MKKFLLIFGALLLSNLSFSHTLNGILTDENAQGIPGAKITLVNDAKTVLTNNLGEFVLQDVHVGDSILIEALGYTKTYFFLDNEKYFQNDYLFLIYSDAQSLEAVDVNAVQGLMSKSANIDITLQPVRTTQDLLALVPGLFVAQHAGGGKAEQLFLRGFDIDHGTDVALSMDGMPVNMVSHAHGQGYADMHFVMQDVIEKIDFGKGPYDVSKGNFATAGFVDFVTKDKLEKSYVGSEYGMFNHKRIFTGINLLQNNNQNAYIAADYNLTDNYFESPQDYNRINIFAKYSGVISSKLKFSSQVSTFQSSWNASGQIPTRAVESGLISRFGAIDDTEGGETSRTNVQFSLISILNNKSTLKSDFYVSDYEFELYSNFTFFLEDSINGDQIKQREKRRIYGAKTEWKHTTTRNKSTFRFTAGSGFRFDDINNIELSKTTARKIVREQIQLGDVNETNIFAYASAEWEIGKFIGNVGLRGDNINFYYQNKLDSVYDPKSLTQSVILPKLNLYYNITKNAQISLKSGVGYHSNDSRVVLQSTDLNGNVLPLAYGSDLGLALKIGNHLLLNTAAWYLFSEQEFVYVGDAGVVEPSGQSERIGGDFSLTYQPLPWLFAYANVNYAHARAVGEPEGQNYIPLAPELTSNGKIQVNFNKGIFANLSYRLMTDRPANEDNSVIAEGYLINDFGLGYKNNRFSITGIIQNVFDQEWNETQFLTETRLQNEPNSVEEICFTPGTPFNFRMQLKFLF